MTRSRSTILALSIVLAMPGATLLAPPARAAVPARGTPAHAHDQPDAAQTDWGLPARGRADRTVEIRMTDHMRFAPDRLQVRQGETVRFRVRNAGRLQHEMVIGNAAEIARHAERMRDAKKGHDHHAAASGVHVAPKKQGEFTWTFNRTGTFEFACLVPGHAEAGMKGTIVVRPAPAPMRRHG